MTAGYDAPLRIFVTRERSLCGILIAELSRAGADVICRSLISIEFVQSGPVDAAIYGLEAYDWLVFTSANAVTALRARMSELGVSPVKWPKTAVVGPATRRQAEAAGFRVEVVAQRHDSDSLGEQLAGKKVGRTLLPVSSRSGNGLRESLRIAGHEVDQITIYKTTHDLEAAADLAARLRNETLDAIVMTSPSNLTSLLTTVSSSEISVPIVCFGSRTASACREAHLSHVVAGSTDPTDVTRAAKAAALDRLKL